MKDKKIIIATHKMVYGVADAMRDYLKKLKIKKLMFIGLPLSYNKKFSLTVLSSGRIIKKEEFQKKIYLGPLDYILEFFYVLFKVFLQKEKYDIFIGYDSLNSFAGLILKRFGKVKKVILFTMDFTPRRFNNALINYIYHKIEKISVGNVDEVWDVSPRMGPARAKFLNIPVGSYRRKIVEVGFWRDKVKVMSFSNIRKNQLLFLGTLYEKQGVQLVLNAIPKIIKKIPDFKFLILGGGEYEDVLKLEAKKLEVEKYVEFKGWINDRTLLDRTISESAAAVACYKPEKSKLYNFSYYGGAGKIKDYMSGSLPVILTNVSYNAKEIDRKKCGILIKYSVQDLSNAITKLMGNEKVLKEYRDNVAEYIKDYEWNKIFSKAFMNI